MVLFGLILLVLGALGIVLGLFDVDYHGSTLKYAFVDLSPQALFLVGVASAVLIWWGLWILKSGSKRSWARRKEQKRLESLSQKLDNVDDRRRMDVEEHEERDRPTL